MVLEYLRRLRDLHGKILPTRAVDHGANPIPHDLGTNSFHSHPDHFGTTACHRTPNLSQLGTQACDLPEIVTIWSPSRHAEVAGSQIRSPVRHRNRPVCEAACPSAVLAHKSVRDRQSQNTENLFRKPYSALLQI